MRVNLPVTEVEYVLPAHEVIVSRTDLKGKITYVNETFVRACGFTRDELVGQPHNIVRHPDMPAAGFEDLWRTIKAGRPWSGLVKNRRKDGGFYWVHANVTPIVDRGQLVGYMSVRTSPSEAEKRAAGELYRKINAGELRGVRLERGGLLHTGPRGAFERLCRMPFHVRCWWTGGALAMLFALCAALALGARGPSSSALAAIGVVGALASLAIGAWWSMNVGRPIEQALAAAIAAVGGEVSASFPRRGETELKKLFRIIDQMNCKLVGVLKDVNGSMQSVGSAAAEIASGNLDLSQRTEEQAASLEQTASSMEELTATVKQNADNARQANELAASASSIAGKGGAVVRTVVETMAGIEASSRKIAEINGTVDALAFQTNILALNAAVEAARAGEQGRGFAVVAGEVRALAQRSAAAAKEIKQLIDRSVAQVSEGTRLAADAGHTMDDLVGAVQRVADIMAEISAASAEQSGGIQQVNQAIAQMDQVTQQNAALVEEVAASADNLQSQMRIVSDALGAFNLAGAAAQAAPAPVRRSAAKPARPLPAVRAAKPAKPAPAPVRASPAGAKTGTDDWTEF